MMGEFEAAETQRDDLLKDVFLEDKKVAARAMGVLFAFHKAKK